MPSALDVLVLGTGNQGKLLELRAVLSGKSRVLSLAEVEAAQPPPEVEEDGSTYRENAFKKAQAYQSWSGLPVLADDSGLEVRALGGAPGVHSARFGGADLPWARRWQHLIASIQATGSGDWECAFRCVLCFFDGEHPPAYFEGVAPGKVLPSPVGSAGFGYDPVVFSHELGMGFAQAAAAEKNRVSHRAKALTHFVEWLDRGMPPG